MASVKQERLSKLVGILESATAWVSAPTLARVLGVSDRSIRSYVKELDAREGVRVESSPEGYRLVTGTAQERRKPSRPAASSHDDSAYVRRNKVCVRLINAPGEVSVYDIADELHVSESTVLNAVMPHVRELFGRYGITVEGHGFRFSLVGSEQDKRRVLGHLATHDTNSYFTSVETLEALFPNFDVEGIIQRAVALCQGSELIINNYALNNLLVHLLIITVRLREGNELEGRDELPVDARSFIERVGQEREIKRLAESFAELAAEEAGCDVPADDYRQIELLIAMSVEHCAYSELDLEKLERLVDKPLLDSVRSISALTTERYGIKPFDDEFLLQLSLHMYNVYQRASFRVRCPNPLAAQIKRDYAPVYDMAVFFCLQFSRQNNIEVNEDEIAFVAFHIGAYLERAKGARDAVNCIVILEDYHAFSHDVVDGIREAFGSEISVSSVMGMSCYLKTRPVCDLLVTTLEMPAVHPRTVYVGPILTRQGIRKIRGELDEIEEERRTKRARAFLRSILSPELYMQGTSYPDADACIRALSQRCMDAGAAKEGLAEDVLAREATSSTAFTDDLAIPHPVNSHANRSFICALHTERPIP